MSSSAFLSPLFLFLLAISSTDGCFTSIFSFGDSIADTGNLLISQKGEISAARSPYGRTYFHRPTGRFSDGRLIIDFIAEALGFPYIRPYLAGPGDGGFRQGVNFAVAGSTALDNDSLREMGIENRFTNFSLQVQRGWFNELLPSLCSTESECRNLLSSSLILAGEIGGNDFNYATWEGKSLRDLQSYIPIVVDSISALINDLIELGAKTFLVPGNFPVGCNPASLINFKNSSADDYDLVTGCINWLNEFSRDQNKQLQLELDRLRALHPQATIIYADYYTPIMNIFSNHSTIGTGRVPLAACCGSGGRYNVEGPVFCGDEHAIVCEDSSSYVYWDLVHMTEATYKTIARGLLEGPFADPPIQEICPHIRLAGDYGAQKVVA